MKNEVAKVLDFGDNLQNKAELNIRLQQGQIAEKSLTSTLFIVIYFTYFSLMTFAYHGIDIFINMATTLVVCVSFVISNSR